MRTQEYNKITKEGNVLDFGTLKETKKQLGINKLTELESEIDAENRRMADALKNLRKSERRIKEMSYATDEDRKNHERMQALVDQLQSIFPTFHHRGQYKRYIEHVFFVHHPSSCNRWPHVRPLWSV